MSIGSEEGFDTSTSGTNEKRYVIVVRTDQNNVSTVSTQNA